MSGREARALLVGEERRRRSGAASSTPCWLSVSSTSSPASTPRLPSKRPPVRTVSMCEPVITGASDGSRAGAGGDDVADRVDRHVEAEVAHPRRRRGRGPSRSASVSARRAQPRSPFGPCTAPISPSASMRAHSRSPSTRRSVHGAGVAAIVSDRSRTWRSRAAPSHERVRTAPSNSSSPRSAVAAVGSPM